MRAARFLGWCLCAVPFAIVVGAWLVGVSRAGW